MVDAEDRFARQLDRLNRELAGISRRADQRHRKLLDQMDERHKKLLEYGDELQRNLLEHGDELQRNLLEHGDELQRNLLEHADARHQQLIGRGRASERIFIDALVDIDASMKRSNERSVEITQSIRDMRESIRANTQAVFSVLDRLGPAEAAG